MSGITIVAIVLSLKDTFNSRVKAWSNRPYSFLLFNAEGLISVMRNISVLSLARMKNEGVTRDKVADCGRDNR